MTGSTTQKVQRKGPTSCSSRLQTRTFQCLLPHVILQPRQMMCNISAFTSAALQWRNHRSTENQTNKELIVFKPAMPPLFLLYRVRISSTNSTNSPICHIIMCNSMLVYYPLCNHECRVPNKCAYRPKLWDHFLCKYHYSPCAGWQEREIDQEMACTQWACMCPSCETNQKLRLMELGEEYDR